MKIGVLGDSHLNMEYLNKVIKELKQVDYIIHTGDNYCDFEYIMEKLKIKGIGVKGNCDPKGPEEIIEEIAGRRFLICHGHRYGVKESLNNLFYRGKEVQADIVIFGHSHVPVYEVIDGLVLLNPGSIAFPRGGSRRSYALLKLNEEVGVSFQNVE